MRFVPGSMPTMFMQCCRLALCADVRPDIGDVILIQKRGGELLHRCGILRPERDRRFWDRGERAPERYDAARGKMFRETRGALRLNEDAKRLRVRFDRIRAAADEIEFAFVALLGLREGESEGDFPFGN